jgi:hypothetical protein
LTLPCARAGAAVLSYDAEWLAALRTSACVLSAAERNVHVPPFPPSAAQPGSSALAPDADAVRWVLDKAARLPPSTAALAAAEPTQQQQQPAAAQATVTGHPLAVPLNFKRTKPPHYAHGGPPAPPPLPLGVGGVAGCAPGQSPQTQALLRWLELPLDLDARTTQQLPASALPGRAPADASSHTATLAPRAPRPQPQQPGGGAATRWAPVAPYGAQQQQAQLQAQRPPHYLVPAALGGGVLAAGTAYGGGHSYDCRQLPPMPPPPQGAGYPPAPQNGGGGGGGSQYAPPPLFPPLQQQQPPGLMFDGSAFGRMPPPPPPPMRPHGDAAEINLSGSDDEGREGAVGDGDGNGGGADRAMAVDDPDEIDLDDDEGDVAASSKRPRPAGVPN